MHKQYENPFSVCIVSNNPVHLLDMKMFFKVLEGVLMQDGRRGVVEFWNSGFLG